MNIRKNLTLEKVENRNCCAGDLHCDVDLSGMVEPLDVLILINSLNSRGIQQRASESPEVDWSYDVNSDGWLTPLDALIVINALNRNREPLQIAVHNTVESDPNSNGIVVSDSVSLMGKTSPFSRLTLTSRNETGETGVLRLASTADAGAFRIDFPLSFGRNQIVLRVRDEIGRTIQSVYDVKRGDVIADWNAASLNVVRDWTTTSNDPFSGRIVPSQPPRVALNLAMIHTAMFDAVNSTSGKYATYAYDGPLVLDASPIAAAAAAAFRVASAVYSDADEIAVWNATLEESLSIVADGNAKAKGLELGKKVGDAILERRANDGSNAASNYRVGNDPGDWNRTAPDSLPPMLPQWQNLIPFAIPRSNSFRPAQPPALGSDQYAQAVDEVFRLGRLDSSARTAEQKEIALFWADGGGTATPPGHWNRIATDVINQEKLSIIESARTMALLNIALADAAIVSWDAKYHYDLWRPIDAIRRADADNNPATIADPFWFPLLKTPPFPTYTSGHSTFSGAASAVLTSLFGSNYAFSSTTDGLTGLAQRPLAESMIVTRHFSSFTEAAEEAGSSRIFGGIHFNFDNQAGLETGKNVGDFVVDKLLKRKIS